MTITRSLSQFVPVGARFPFKALCVITCFVLFLFASFASAQAPGTCSGMQVGTPTYGPNGGNLNGFVPFPSTNAWNTNIAGAPVDPNSSAIAAAWNAAGGYKLHPSFGEVPGDGGIPYIVVDSTVTPSVSINVMDYPGDSDVVVAPYPANVPIEGAYADCSGWPDVYQSDAHTNVLDRATCWEYETFNTNRCNGQYDASEEVIWDMTNGEMRPWGWTSTDAAGLSVFAGLEKYSEAASGTVSHAIRFSMQHTLGDSNNGYFVIPASHGASTSPTLRFLQTHLLDWKRLWQGSAYNESIFLTISNYAT